MPPGTLAGADEVAEAANALIDAIGHDRLMEVEATKKTKPYLASGFLEKKKLGLDSPYLRFALNECVLRAVTAYLGMVPVLNQLDVWYSVPQVDALVGSQLWHLDHDDTMQVKVWVHCSDIGPESGPLTALDATHSAELAKRIGYDMGTGYRVPDKQLAHYAASDAIVAFEGPRGTVDFVDTSSCFHFGSRLAPGAPPRRTTHFMYVTPYSFNYVDHREQARFRKLAPEAESELQRLVLGAV